MIIVQGYMRVAPEKFALYTRRIADHSAVVATSEGCLQYSISEDPGEAGLLWVGERWRDKASQAVHLASDHMATFNNFMKHMHLKSADIAVYDCDSEGQWIMRVAAK
jgi:quinol monooxygenase YgiN